MQKMLEGWALFNALLLQGAKKVERFHRTPDRFKEPAGIVCGELFDRPLPARVTIIALSFAVSTYYPSPCQCRKCWRIGHTKNHCTNSDNKCKKCGESHDQTTICSQKCINCTSPDHTSDSKLSPAYRELSSLIKFASDNDVTIKEARSKIYKSSSVAASRSTATSLQPKAPQKDLDRLKADINNIQEELKSLKNDTIAPIEKSG